MQFDVRSADELWLLRLMERQGNTVLRCCLLLCGDPDAAHSVARRAFVHALGENSAEHGELAPLLRFILRECPIPARRKPSGSAAADRLLALPPDLRRAAVAVLYAGLPLREAAWALETTERRLTRLLHRAQERLDSKKGS